MKDMLPAFLFYVLPVWNVIVLLAVNRRTKFRNIILILSTLLNTAGLFMLYNGAVTMDEKTHTRALRILYFFVLLELFLLIIWNRKQTKPPQNENAHDQ